MVTSWREKEPSCSYTPSTPATLKRGIVFERFWAKPREVKTEADVEYVRGLMQKYEAIEYAVKIAKQFASQSQGRFAK